MTYNPRPTDPPYYFFGDDGNDLMEVFRTYVVSATTTTLSIQIDGDDGHSLFVNGAFVTGGPFGDLLTYDLALTAGVPVEIELVDHNGPGPWYASLSTQSGQTIDSVPGIMLNADGNFPAVPEPSTLGMMLVGLAGLAVRRWRGRLPDRRVKAGQERRYSSSTRFQVFQLGMQADARSCHTPA